MGLGHGPNIVKDGLVFYVDAANPKSYPGSGVAWNSLQTPDNSVTLTNGPSFQSLGNGSINFDGNDDIGILNYDNSLSNSPTTFSIDMWVNVGNIGSKFVQFMTNRDNSDLKTTMAIGIDNRQLVRIWNPSGNDHMVTYVHISNGSTSYYSFKKELFGTTNGDNQWHNITGTYSKSNSELKLYYDGVLQHTVSISIDLYNSLVDWRIGSGYSYGAEGQYDYDLVGNISNIKMYHKALTQTEVTQNYNALKPRFN